MSFFADMLQAVQEARDERDAAVAMAARDGRRADDLEMTLYDVTQRLEFMTLDVSALKEELVLKDAVISNLNKQLDEKTLLVQTIREEASNTLATSLGRCEDMLSKAKAAHEAVESKYNSLLQVHMDLSAAFHELAGRNQNIVNTATVREHNYEAELTEMWADLQQAKESLRAISQDFAAAQAYILSTHFTKEAILTIALLEQARRSS